MEKRKRSIDLHFRVTPEEKQKIDKLMKEYNIKEFAKFARRMIIQGHYLIIDWRELLRLRRQLSGIATNINQVAYRANVTRYIRQADIDYLKSQLNEIIRLFNVYLKTFEKLDDLVTKASK